MIKKLKKLIKTPNIYFYDFFAKKLKRPTFSQSIKNVREATIQIPRIVTNMPKNDLVDDYLNLSKSIKNLQNTVQAHFNVIARQIRYELYRHNERLYHSLPWDVSNGKTYVTIRYLRHLRHYSIFFDNLSYINTSSSANLESSFSKSELHIIHGQNVHALNAYDISECMNRDIPICYGEDGFLHSICRPVDFSVQSNYRTGCSLTLDFFGAHFDCRHISWLERFLNSDYEFSKAELERAEKNIKYIISNYLSKYNNQPIYTPQYGRQAHKKVLVIDQAINDFSILLGGCSENTFIAMLEDAINENPDADILVKVHPDMIANPNRGGSGSKKYGHFSNINMEKYGKNIILIADYINPIALLQSVDKVYVASSQMGFEALLCGKEVYIYGCPYYAGWGIGECRGSVNVLNRRNRKRSVTEIFAAAYIKYSRYINPDLGHRCEIEECLEFLHKYRDQYFIENGIRHDLIDIKDRKANNTSTVINIAFCFDARYYKQAIVAIISLLNSNTDSNVKYAIYCVVESDVLERHLNEINSYVQNHAALHLIKFVYNNPSSKNLYECRGITKAAYTRLMLHNILPDIDKVIYSDIDVIFNGSLLELWETSLGSYMMGACIDPLMNQEKRWKDRVNKYPYWGKLLFNAQDNYFSSGLLLLNLSLMRESKFDEQIQHLTKEQFEYQDMDIINISINNKIKPLSNKYCVLNGLIDGGYKNTYELGIIPKSYLDDIYNDPKIFHFAGKKPWNDQMVPKSDIWWSVAGQEKVLYDFFKSRLNRLEK